jgi:hypothetical protein
MYCKLAEVVRQLKLHDAANTFGKLGTFACMALTPWLSLPLFVTLAHGLIYYKETKLKCRHLRKLTCKWTLRQVFVKVYRLEMQSVMLVFFSRPRFVIVCPSNLFSDSPPPYPPS